MARRWGVATRIAVGPALGLTLAVLAGCAPAQGLNDAPAQGSRDAPAQESRDAPSSPPGRDVPSQEDVVATLPDGEDVVVERIVDGDTLVVGGGERVRLIGIDTPESVHPSKPVECFGPEASAHLAGLLPEGTPVRLVHDVERHDRYGRTLAYVWRADGLDVNRTMVEDGYAMVYTVPPNVDRQQDFLDAQHEAREADRGLWGGCDGELAFPPPDPAAPAGGERDANGDCHAAYADVCIPPPPPDLNCGDVPHRQFRVLPPDPHNFDGDGDGIGCQS